MSLGWDSLFCLHGFTTDDLSAYQTRDIHYTHIVFIRGSDITVHNCISSLTPYIMEKKSHAPVTMRPLNHPT